MKLHLAVFASGNGTNAENLVKYFDDHPDVSVIKILTNKWDALVLERAKRLDVPIVVFSKKEFEEPAFLHRLHNIDYLIFAGFLWLAPKYLIDAFPGKVINIHPSLLPKFGGKGMYGLRIHREVIHAREQESGVTIHLVNENYDGGAILFQVKCRLKHNETAATLAEKVHQLEYEHFPRVVEQYILRQPTRPL